MNTTEVNRILKDACEKMGCPALFPRISWDFNSRFVRRLGDASYASNHIRLSTKLFALATPAQREDTIRHEAAHLAVGFFYSDRVRLPKSNPRSISAHGSEWKALARKAGATPRACSKRIEGSEALRTSRKRFAAYCACGDHPVTKTVARRLSMGTRYSCRVCKCFLTREPIVKVLRAADTLAAAQVTETPAVKSAMEIEIERLRKENMSLEIEKLKKENAALRRKKGLK